jgi:DNA-binding transcriptional LysR family regulator
MILYDELFTFIKVFENKNYTITAKLLGVSQPSIKRQIENLEKSFNKKLIRSNANNIEITEFGKKVYDCFKGKDKELESMINLLIKEDHKIEGDLLVTLPVNLSAKLITPYLPEFLQKHPNLRLKINFKQVEPNLYNTGFDIAVSLTAPTQESLIVKMLFKTKICLYATRKYIQKYGEPKTFDNINRNHTVSYLNLDDPKEASSINFKNKDTGEITTVQNDCIVTLNNVTNGLVLLRGC